MEDAVACFKYFAGESKHDRDVVDLTRPGLADKVQGSVIELDDQSKYATTRREPIGSAVSAKSNHHR